MFKKIVITLCVLFVLFGTFYSHNVQSGMSTDMYVQELQQQITYLQQKVNDGTATTQDIATLRYLRQRLAQLGR